MPTLSPGFSSLQVSGNGPIAITEVVYIWPVSLPQSFLIRGFSEEIPDTSITTQMQSGVSKKRQLYTGASNPISGNLYMTSAQTSTLDTFYNSTLQGGSLKFTWTHPRTGATETFRFRGPPAYSPAGVDWLVAVDLEILP